MTTSKKKKELPKVNIPALRAQLVELMKDGFNEIPLEDLLHIIRTTCVIEEGDK